MVVVVEDVGVVVEMVGLIFVVVCVGVSWRIVGVCLGVSIVIMESVIMDGVIIDGVRVMDVMGWRGVLGSAMRLGASTVGCVLRQGLGISRKVMHGVVLVLLVLVLRGMCGGMLNSWRSFRHVRHRRLLSRGFVN
jgi:hypothetical protein